MTIAEGDRMPAFTLTDHTGSTFDSGSLAGSRVLIYFYPKAFTPGCTTEACDFRDRHEAFEAAGYRIVGVSPDAPPDLAAFRLEHGLPFPMLSDPDHRVAEAFGAWGTKRRYGREYEGIIRSTFAVDEEGTIVGAWRNVRATGHAGRVLDAVG